MQELRTSQLYIPSKCSPSTSSHCYIISHPLNSFYLKMFFLVLNSGGCVCKNFCQVLLCWNCICSNFWLVTCQQKYWGKMLPNQCLQKGSVLFNHDISQGINSKLCNTTSQLTFVNALFYWKDTMLFKECVFCVY